MEAFAGNVPRSQDPPEGVCEQSTPPTLKESSVSGASLAHGLMRAPGTGFLPVVRVASTVVVSPLSSSRLSAEPLSVRPMSTYGEIGTTICFTLLVGSPSSAEPTVSVACPLTAVADENVKCMLAATWSASVPPANDPVQ